MRDVTYTLPGSETVTLTGQIIDKLIRTGDGDAALLYLYIMKTRGQCSPSEAAAALGKSLGEIDSAMAALSRIGLIHLENADNTGVHSEKSSENPEARQQGENSLALPDDELQKHTVADMKRELESGSVFYSLVEETQKNLGKILSPNELMKLFGIFADLKMEPAVILLLITHCITESRPNSAGRMPPMGYIEKAAYQWEREGLLTIDKAENYLKELNEIKTERKAIMSALNIWDREPSPKERKYIDKWIAMGFKAAAVSIAFGKMMEKTGELVWPYIDTILCSWHNKGTHTPQEIMEKEKPQKKTIADAHKKTPAQKYGTEDKEEVERMQRMLNKLKEE